MTAGRRAATGCSKKMWYVMTQSYECRILVCRSTVRTRAGNSRGCGLTSICCSGHADMQNGLPISARCHFAGLRGSVTREGRLTITHLVGRRCAGAAPSLWTRALPCTLRVSLCGNRDFCLFGEDVLERKPISLDSLFKTPSPPGSSAS